ncbi:YopJ family acetyltransferase [Yersinia similis]|uniref:YopJ family acetyltransferase n=1 Tax=Yersinia similis TaxID=367190 RepID=UPI00384D8417
MLPLMKCSSLYPAQHSLIEHETIVENKRNKVIDKLSTVQNDLLNLKSFASDLQSSWIKTGTSNVEIIRGEKIEGINLLKYGLNHTSCLLKNNIQSNSVSNIYDRALMNKICLSETIHHGKEIIDFNSTDELINYIGNNENCEMRAVVRMANIDQPSKVHYTCFDVSKMGNNTSLMVYEPAFIKDNTNAHVYNGLQSLLGSIIYSRETKELSHDVFNVGFVEMGIQKSPYDCAIYSVSIANNLNKHTEFSKKMLDSISNKPLSDYGVVFFYESSAENTVNNKDNKIKTNIPPMFLKHSTSLSGIKKSDIDTDDIIINKKNETLSDRIKNNFIERGGVTCSNSIEKKRLLFIERAVVSEGVYFKNYI